MKKTLFKGGNSSASAYVISVLLVAIIVTICFLFSKHMDYRTVGLILMLTVCFITMTFDIWPVVVSALVSALAWNFFFIPPTFTFSIGNPGDILIFCMYFVIAILNGVITYKIRQMENAALKKEERAHTLKLYGTLLNSLSDELRTPISTIAAATHDLQSNQATLSDEIKNKLISEISKASLHLNQEIEDLLNMSRIESGATKPQKDWVNIEELIFEVVKGIEGTDLTQPIHINIPPGLPLFKLDKSMMKQSIYNILYNARFYSPKKTRIDIYAAYHIDVLQITIEDDGKGFPDQEISKVFDKFYRFENSHSGGSGLGLSVAKGFIEAQKGSVKLHNVPTGGAKFTIDIATEIMPFKNLK